MFEQIYVVFAVGVLALWLVCSIILQFNPPWFSFIERYDSLMLLPRWTFFAPRPGMSDYHLLYRDYSEDGSPSTWVEIPITEERKPFSWIWNPEKKSKKVLSDVVASLVQLRDIENIALVLSLPYLILLNVVVHHGEIQAGVKRQFVLVEKFRNEDGSKIQLVLVSASHPLRRPQQTVPDKQTITPGVDNALASANNA
jgi:hypothetical protein